MPVLTTETRSPWKEPAGTAALISPSMRRQALTSPTPMKHLYWSALGVNSAEKRALIHGMALLIHSPKMRWRSAGAMADRRSSSGSAGSAPASCSTLNWVWARRNSLSSRAARGLSSCSCGNRRAEPPNSSSTSSLQALMSPVSLTGSGGASLASLM